MAVWSHCSSGPCMTAFTTFVTHACPFEMESGGCSLSPYDGMTHDTDGRFPCAASSKKRAWMRMFENPFVALTVRNPGSGFWIGLVLGFSRGSQGGSTQVPRPT